MRSADDAPRLQKRTLLLLWILSGGLVTLLRLMHPAELGFDPSIQLQAAQSLVQGKGLAISASLHAPIDEWITKPGRRITMVHFPCGYSVIAAVLMFFGMGVAAIIKILGAVASMTGWWGWGRLSLALSGDARQWSPLQRNLLYAVALLTPLLFTPPWHGTEIFLWACVPWLLFLLSPDRETGAGHSLAAGMLCGFCLLIKYQGLFLAIYAVVFLLWQSRRFGVFLRNCCFFGIGFLPAALIQIWLKLYFQSSQGMGGIALQDQSVTRITGLLKNTIWLLPKGMYLVVFWLPGRLSDGLTTTAKAAPWLFPLAVLVLSVPVWLWFRYRSSRYEPGAARLLTALAGLLTAFPALLFVCSLIGSYKVIAVPRYYWPVIPAALLVACWLAFHDPAAKGAAARVVPFLAKGYVFAFVVWTAAAAVSMLGAGQTGVYRRQMLIGSPSLDHWPAWRLNYEWSPAREQVYRLLREDPNAVLVTKSAQWFIADTSIDPARIMSIVPCRKNPAVLTSSAPVRILVLASDKSVKGDGPLAVRAIYGQHRIECLEALPDLHLLEKFPDEGLKLMEAQIPANSRFLLRK